MDDQQHELLASDTTTNAFTSSELAQAVLEAQALRPLAPCSQVSSGDTNPFTSDEIGHRAGAETVAADKNAPTGDEQSTQQADIRIILSSFPRKPMAVKVAPRGSASAASRQPTILDAAAAPDGPAFSKLTIAQSGLDIAFNILAEPMPERSSNSPMPMSGGALNLDVYFDPGGDRIVIINGKSRSITVKSFIAGQDENSLLTQSAIELKPSTPTFLDLGPWAMSMAAEGSHMLQVTVLPRRYASNTVVETRARSEQGSKRAYEASQTISSVKKGRTEDSQPKPGATVVFQAVPITQNEGPIAGGTEESPSRSVAPKLRHPLELEPGATARVFSHEGGYTLTCCETINVMRNSLVFKARHSRISEIVAAKVFRTPSYPVESGIQDESASKIFRTSEMWLKEIKNHSKLSQHAAVVRLYDADARFLSLYMEHVDAPNLASYRLRSGICTLGIDEAKQILADMSTAVFYVHSQGIVHNDIKPANILFKRPRGAVLIDFGLSSESKDSTVHVGGSPWYVPREYAILGKRGVPGDIFALGVVMLFVLGKLPLPDFQPPLKWIIADVWKRQEGQNAARSTMLRWLEIVDQASRNQGGLRHPPLEALVREMLLDVPERISVSELLRRQGLDH